ncbi:hypothetical protein MKW98_015817 [Papaver atlanticum]|uniref:Structural maintenance of chromosomes protein n=1 Tax=Papaver atlanticum TaxID=357466 RepID=A0AAD4TAV3_9MAGN|nr:hypothetical protein MKW98_015817 [Papaver atlanticum]
MHIKQIIIQGFKSYREQTETEEFSPKVNCVVGANGSGKTNFFHAIRFVLSFDNLRNEERHALFHEGAGHQVLSAFVEIVFDNSDNRMPVDKQEVRLRRTIGLKKDDYYLDKKHITKTEVMNLLESAGFSRSNPYYVVQQGKITTLALMKDSERLDLLKEIAGTRVYEERRRESLKIMKDTDNKKKQMIQVVQYLVERLKELDEEKEELKKYQQLDKKRRSLEYAIYDKQLVDARQQLEAIEEARNKASETSAKMYRNVVDVNENAKKLDKEAKELHKCIQVLSKEKEVIEKQRTEAMRKHAQVDVDVRDLEERISGSKREEEKAARELDALEREIQESKNELETIRVSYSNQMAKEEKITKGIMDREKQLSFLYQKQGRATQFTDKVARDEWLQKEVDDLERVLSSNLEQEKKLQNEIQDLKSGSQKQAAYIEEQEMEYRKLESCISKNQDAFSSLKKQRDKLQDKTKSLRETESELSSEIRKLRSEYKKATKNLEHATPGDIRRGLNSVRRLCKDHNIPGVYGPIIELFECEDKFFTAVDVTAGNSLFHVVVETDEISTRLIRYLNSEKGGRITFIPLNRVNPPHVEYPNNCDVVPMLKKLRFSPHHNPAFQQVFGRTVICRNLDVAATVAKVDNFDCITLEGDQVSKKGGMTGGFYDHRRSKLRYMAAVKQNDKAVTSKQEELNKLISELEVIDQEMTKLGSEKQNVDAEQSHNKSELEQIRQDIVNAKKQKESISKALQNKEKLLANSRTQIDQLQTSKAVKQSEMGREIIDPLSPNERDLLSRLNPEITELKENLIACKTDRIETETRKGEHETNLSTNLLRRQQELKAITSSYDADTLLWEVEQKRHDRIGAKESFDDATQRLNRVSKKIDEQTKLMKDIKEEKNKLKALEDKYESTLQESKDRDQQLLSKRKTFLAKQEDCIKKIRDLGSLPADAFETRKNIKELHNMLQKCNEELQQFSHVNKKALDQCVNFTEQREELQQRQAELDAGDDKIKELIEVLDHRKDESIERTFKGVARHFREAFFELVPGGHGYLVMMKKKDADHGDDVEPREADAEGRIEKYIGVRVEVSFTGKGERQSMKQLSGGQKTVVALALIFAIQRCDPAPFYLFDEIDAALDPQYRTAVGNMIRRLADMANTQFITTTFRTELVTVADKIYGVTHKNRVSFVNVISKDQALRFIEHDQSHNAE